ncbi:MAG: PQQ-binding-like beta-propeller repeat protein [Lentisphaerae bacterium]|jgi:outer membrane protein assembly factor BamB|nr:PQQ-binding-like beta-propeller repeat protein [Lentisphaerota bacterium]MBT4818309.1 PQQ-binding-like beta-propeller repeat protein [Lentisphaerota bacterium]MBT5610430.1 PQQ-binding-like beta-propeller repeat protein [Lentisphaerota bacterium]MBT7061021.1 PQQ-binding-like beta-propeller repeat protein [Lentisphaerota bacterium]MBT7842194.1 PQQ-binding-like beta-propeller repeat protein [Lentisphaerota bacterium]
MRCWQTATGQRYFALLCTGLLGIAAGVSANDAELAGRVLAAAAVRGGAVVHIGCGDGNLTIALRGSSAYVVQGLSTREEDVRQTQSAIQTARCGGSVSAGLFDGKALPYADNLVNVVVVSQDWSSRARPNSPLHAEIMRILCPGGSAVFLTSIGEEMAIDTVRKRRPPDIDDWSHFLHDASNNAVANDTQVGPPRHLQWLASPVWLRSHETASGVQAQITSGGRLFYIFDEGVVGITDERLPERWSIVCRDAFNGKLLWKRPMPDWGWRQWQRKRFEDKDWTKLRAARVSAPTQTNRRLVADGDRLYATLGYRGPVAIIDAATGDVVKMVPETRGAVEILASEGTVVAVVSRAAGSDDQGKRRGTVTAAERALVAFRGDSGSLLWEKKTGTVRGLLAAIDAGRVVCQEGNRLRCLDLNTGAHLWQAEPKIKRGRSLVLAEETVLILGGNRLEGRDASSGEFLWHHDIPRSHGAESVDLFVVDGLVWPGMTSVDASLKATKKSARALAVGYDIRTGVERRKVVVDHLRSPEHHHRCYRNKATSRFMISGFEGAEFLDLTGEGHSQNNWLRGACKQGVMPANGMLYVPPDQCFCQPGAKLLGYAAVRSAAVPHPAAIPDDHRLERGPAYGHRAMSTEADPVNEWPTFRHDAARHGSTPTTVPFPLKSMWQIDVGGKLTAPVAAGGKLVVADTEAHTIRAYEADTGRLSWQFTAGGRIDSPPTVYRGLVLFGAADGRVTCLRADDGSLIWRFLAAPVDRRVLAMDQFESVWPVHGSVLVTGGVAYVTAGRSSYLDGGIHVYALAPESGRLLHRGLVEGPHPPLSKDRDVAFYIRGANSDVLVSEGDSIFMRQKTFTRDLENVPEEILSSKGEMNVGLHVFATSGFLDGSWYNRTFWMYSKRWPGFQLANQAPKAGQLIVVDEDTTYALRVFYRRNVHSPMFFPGREGYLLFADKSTNEPQIVGEDGAKPPLRWLPQSDYHWGKGDVVRKLDTPSFGKDKLIGYTRAEPPLWTLWLPVRVRAMVKAGDALFVAGPPDVLDDEDPFAAFEGRGGAVLVVVSARDGKKGSEIALSAPPVFDGMIAAYGRIYASLTNGTVVCLGGEQ